MSGRIIKIPFGLIIVMLYLYIGYLLIQLNTIIKVMSTTTMSIEAIIFSIVVFFIWSFIPLLGYVIAKMFKAKGSSSKLFLLLYGATVGLIEKGLLQLNIETINSQYIAYISVIILFTGAAFVSVKFSQDKHDEFESAG